MAITITTLNSGVSTANSTSYVTGAYTPTSNSLVLLAFCNRSTSDAAALAGSVSGNGCTWERIQTRSGANQRVTVYRALPSAPAAGQTTIHFDVGSQDYFVWTLAECAGVSQDSTDGAGAIVQSTRAATTASTALTISLSPFANTSNVGYGFFAQESTVRLSTGSGFTPLSSVQGTDAAGGVMVLSEFAVNATAVVGNSALVSTSRKQGIAMEIAEFVAAVEEQRLRRKMMGVGR